MRLLRLLFVAGSMAVSQAARAEVGISSSDDGSVVSVPGYAWINQKPVDTVLVLDGNSGKELNRLGANVNSMLASVLSPDGKMLVICGTETKSIGGEAAAKQSRELREKLQQSAGDNAFMQGFMEAAGAAATDKLTKMEVPYLAWLRIDNGQIVHRINISKFVNAAAFSPDGKTVAAGTSDNKVHLYDVASGKLLRTLSGLQGEVAALSFKADGTRLAARGDKVILWDVATGKVVRTLPVAPITNDYHFSQCMSLSPNGLYAGVSDGRQRLDVWDIATGKLLRTIKDAQAFSFSADSTSVATGSEKGQVKLWNIATGKVTRVFDGLSAFPYPSVEWVRLTPKGGRLIASGGEHVSKIFDVASGKERLTCNGSKAPIKDVSFDGSGERLLTASSRGELRIVDPTTGSATLSVLSPTDTLHVAFSPDSTIFAVGKTDGIEIYDATSAKPLRKINTGDKKLVCMQFSPDGKKLAGGFMESIVTVWDAQTGAELYQLGSVPTAADKPQLTGTDLFSMDFKKLQAQVDQKLKDSANQPRHIDAILDLAFSPDGNLLATSSRDTTIRLWDANTGKFQRTFLGHAAQVNGVTFNENGSKLISGDYDGVVILWDPQTANALQKLKTPDGGTADIAAIDDGKTIITTSMIMEKPNFIRFLDATTGSVIRTIPLGIDYPNKFEVSRDKKRLTATSNEGVVRVWDINSGEAHIFDPK